MAMIIDVSYYSWDRAYATWKAAQEGRTIDSLATLHTYMQPNTVLAFDGKGSMRKDSLPWYKTNRSDPDQTSRELRVIAENLQDQIGVLYPHQSIKVKGLEGDDVIAIAAEPGDIIIGNDKDYLQLHKDILVMNLRSEFWGCERFKAPWLPIERGNKSLAYQLLYGDVADNIPRRWYGDKDTIAEVFEYHNPLYAAISLLPIQQVKTSLVALMLPCPLYNPTSTIIDMALERYA